MKLQEGIQNLPQLKERQTELNNLLVTTATNIQETQGKVPPLRLQLKAAITEKTQHKESNRVKVNQMQSKLYMFKKIDDDIQR